LAMRSSVFVSQAKGSTPFTLAVCKSVAIACAVSSFGDLLVDEGFEVVGQGYVHGAHAAKTGAMEKMARMT
jgi:hypothetical protein